MEYLEHWTTPLDALEQDILSGKQVTLLETLFGSNFVSTVCPGVNQRWASSMNNSHRLCGHCVYLQQVQLVLLKQPSLLSNLKLKQFDYFAKPSHEMNHIQMDIVLNWWLSRQWITYIGTEDCVPFEMQGWFFCTHQATVLYDHPASSHSLAQDNNITSPSDCIAALWRLCMFLLLWANNMNYYYNGHIDADHLHLFQADGLVYLFPVDHVFAHFAINGTMYKTTSSSLNAMDVLFATSRRALSPGFIFPNKASERYIGKAASMHTCYEMIVYLSCYPTLRTELLNKYSALFWSLFDPLDHKDLQALWEVPLNDPCCACRDWVSQHAYRNLLVDEFRQDVA